VVSLLKELAPKEVADVGCGGGVIGVCVAIACPEIKVTLIEPVDRKFRFLNGLGAQLKIPLRVSKKPAGKDYPWTFDAVVARALAPLPEAVAVCLPLLKPGGRFIAYQSDAPDPENFGLKKALAKAGGRLLESKPYRLPGESKDRHLAVIERCIS
jgi:16S rRNA (guanine527-N7)-methyltransferase